LKSLKPYCFFKITAQLRFLQTVVKRKKIVAKISKRAIVAKNARVKSDKIHLQTPK